MNYATKKVKTLPKSQNLYCDLGKTHVGTS